MEEVRGGGRKSRSGEICDLCASCQMLLGCPNKGEVLEGDIKCAQGFRWEAERKETTLKN